MSLSSDLAAAQRRPHAIAVTLDDLDRVAQMELDAHLLERGLRELHDALVVAGKHLLHELDDGDLGTERRVRARELEPDHATADDDDVLGNLAQSDGVVARPHALHVVIDVRQLEDRRAGREDDRVVLDGLRAPFVRARPRRVLGPSRRPAP